MVKNDEKKYMLNKIDNLRVKKYLKFNIFYIESQQYEHQLDKKSISWEIINY